MQSNCQPIISEFLLTGLQYGWHLGLKQILRFPPSRERNLGFNLYHLHGTLSKVTRYQGKFPARILTEYSKSARIEQNLTFLSLFSKFLYFVLFFEQGSPKIEREYGRIEFSTGTQLFYDLCLK